MVIGMALFTYSIVNIANDPLGDIISYLQGGSTLLALVSGFIFIVNGYKKNAAAYYKGYVLILLIAEAITTCVAITYDASYLIKFARIAAVILFTILAVGKDLGKRKSIIISVALLVIEIAILANTIVLILPYLSATSIPYLFDPIGHVILAITTIFMVCGKYIDKDSRGAK